MADTSDLAARRPLLTTKLTAPPVRGALVARPRLLERLDAAAAARLTLVSAPAGFGKTTLLAAWASGRRDAGEPVAWVSLGAGENEPASFWTYVVTALRSVDPEVGEDALELLSSGGADVEGVLATLVNDLSRSGRAFTLVLDDYHEIESAAVHEGLAFLLEHAPAGLRVVIAGRADPPLPLARLRARGELTEIRAAELRFTAEEAAAFLGEVMGLDLAAADVVALEERTEGWIAGLQLAALSMQGREDVSGFVAAFAGEDRYIVDYLVEEVLARQPEKVRRFLLQTSILERLSGPLCDAVTGESNGRETLEALERSNLFVVPLDDRRQWYRYHQLFADVLRAHAADEQPVELAELHRRASAWLEANGAEAAAIEHALASGDDGRAAQLIELAWPEMERTRQTAIWLRWARQLPNARVRERARLSAAYGWALLAVEGDLEQADARLDDAERALEAGGAEPAIAAAIASGRAYIAQARGDLATTVAETRRVLELAPADDLEQRGSAAGLLAMAAWAQGDLDEAGRTLDEAIARAREADNAQYVVTSSYVLSAIRREQGRLRDAETSVREALALAEAAGDPVRRSTADLHGALAELHLQRNGLEAAAQELATSRERGSAMPLPHWPYRWHVAQAGLAAATGDLETALGLLEEAEELHVRGPVPDVRPVGALRARIWIRQGRIDEALQWASEAAIRAEDEPTYLGEFAQATLARALIAQHDGNEPAPQTVQSLIARLVGMAESQKRTGSLVELLVLQAVALRAGGERSSALDSLRRALELAEPEGFARVFLDEGQPMHALLREEVQRSAAEGRGSGYATELLTAFEQAPAASSATSETARQHELIEPLTSRELEILRLIASGMRNQEIADHLVISVATVKRHIANAYGKLDVSHRTEAVARANELGLL